MKWLAGLFVCLLAVPVAAQPSEAQTAYEAGQARYVKGDYEGAAEHFKRAYRLEPDPVYLFNIGQAYRLANKCEDAAISYRLYLREAKQPPNEAAVQKYLVELDVCAKRQAPTPSAIVSEPAPRPPVPAPPPTPRDRERGSSRRTLAFVIGGAGAVLAATGFYFMHRVSNDEADANAVCPGCTTWTPEHERARNEADRRGARDEKIMATSLIVGGAAVATGVVLFVMTGRETESPVAIAPTRGGAMVSLTLLAQ